MKKTMVVGILFGSLLAACTDGIQDEESAEACSTACGPGFGCDASSRCVLAATAEVDIELVSPARNASLSQSDVLFECQVSAPQLRSVSLIVSSAEGPTTYPLVKQANRNVWETLTPLENGTFRAACSATFGPEKAEVESASVDVTFSVDSIAPDIKLTSPAAWLMRSQPVTLAAVITDVGGLDKDSVRLWVESKSFQGVLTTGNAFEFAVVLTDVVAPGFEGDVAYEVRAKDVADNRSAVAGTLQVDDVAPSVTVLHDYGADWRDDSKFTFELSASSTGAPIRSATLSGADGAPKLEITGEHAAYAFEVDPAEWPAQGSDGLAPWILRVEDEAGNVAEERGAFKIDRVAPVITVNAPTDWFSAEVIDVLLIVSEAGSGVADVDWSVGPAKGSCSRTGSIWKCPISTSSQAKGTANEQFAFVVSARDNSGNVASSTGVLKVDKQAPTGVIEGLESWHGRTKPIEIVVAVSDAHSGASTNVPILDVGSTKSYSGTMRGNTFVYTVLPADVLQAGQESGAITVAIRAKDVAGNEVTLSGHLKVDDKKPTVSINVIYPTGRSTVVVRDPFSNRSQAIATVTAIDSGSGVGGVTLKYGSTDIPLESVSGNKYVFVFDAAAFVDKTKSSSKGNFVLTAKATDVVGLSFSENGDVAYDRTLWTKTLPMKEEYHGTSSGTSGAVALARDHLYIALNKSGSEGDNVFAIKSESGATSWSAAVEGAPTTGVTIAEVEDSLRGIVSSDGNNGQISVFDLSKSDGSRSKMNEVGQTKGSLAFAPYAWEATVAGDGPLIPTLMYVTANSVFRARELRVSSGGVSILPLANASISQSAPEWTAPLVTPNAVFVGSSTGRVARAVRKKGVPDSGGVSSYSWESLVTEPMGDSINALAANIRDGVSVVNAGSLHWLDVRLNTQSFPIDDAAGRTSVVIGTAGATYFGVSDRFDVARSFVHINPPKPAEFRPAPGAVTSSPVIGRLLSGEDQIYTVDGAALRAWAPGLSSQNWQHSLGNGVHVSPALDCNGVLYLITSKGVVHAVVTDSVGLSPSAWPRYQHDNRNTGDASYKTWVGNTCID